MPADALPLEPGARATTGPMTVGTGFTLTFGTYSEPTFIGMTATITRSAPLVDGSGNVSQLRWSVTVAPDGTASVGPLPYNDDGTTYTVEWQALSYKPTPGNRTIQILSSSGLTTVDFDTLQTISPDSTVAVPVDAAVAALLSNTSSATYAKALALIAARAGFGGI